MGSYLPSFSKSPSDPSFTTTDPAKPALKPQGPNDALEFSSDSAADFLDVVFCIDTTGSMGSYIERSKKVIINMINTFSQQEEKPLFAVVAYKDHPPQDTTYITKIHPLGDAAKALSFVQSLNASGGGDTPEAVLQGLSDSVHKIKWRNIQDKDTGKTYKKLLIHVGDAPPHGKEFHANCDDHWPNGCPSKITLNALASAMNQNDVYYHFCRLNTSTDVMCEKFRKSFKHYEVIDLMVNAENLAEQKKEFAAYVAACDVKEYKDCEFEKMSSTVQNECLYEAKVTNCMFKNMKRK